MKLSTKIILPAVFAVISMFVAYQMTTTYKAHETFDGYCKWRGLAFENMFNNYGYCKNLSTGKEYKMVLFKNRWYLDSDLPCGFLCF